MPDWSKIPGINEENTTRRNALVGGGYAFLGLAAIGAIADPDTDDDDNDNGDDSDENGNVDDDEPAPTNDNGEDDDQDENGEEDDDEDDDPDPMEIEFVDGPLVSLSEADDDWFFEDPVHFDGDSSTVTESIDFPFGIVAIEFDHEGESNFIVEGVPEGGEEVLLVNEIGPVDGIIAVTSDGTEFVIDVEADGPWSITVSQPEPPMDVFRRAPTSAEGQGSDLIGPFHVDGSVTVEAEYDGEGNFIVEAIEEWADSLDEVELLVNDIGETDTIATLEGDDWWGWIDVLADHEGEWSINIES